MIALTIVINSLVFELLYWQHQIIEDTLEKGNSQVFQMTPRFEKYLTTLLQKKYEKATQNQTVR